MNPTSALAMGTVLLVNVTAYRLGGGFALAVAMVIWATVALMLFTVLVRSEEL